MKPIRFSLHAREQLFFRGITEEEIIEAIGTSQWQPAELGRLQCKKDFPYEKEWNKMYYNTKQVRPIFVEEEKKKGGAKVRITYDSEVDALYIRFIETTVTTKHVAEGIAVDYDAEGHIAGVEILDAVKRFGSRDVFRKVSIEDLAI